MKYCYLIMYCYGSTDNSISKLSLIVIKLRLRFMCCLFMRVVKFWGLWNCVMASGIAVEIEVGVEEIGVGMSLWFLVFWVFLLFWALYYYLFLNLFSISKL